MEKEGPLDQLLDDEGRAGYLVLVCGVLIQIGSVRLEDAHPVSRTTTDSVVIGHDFAQLVERLEDMNTNPSIESSGFKEP